VLCNCGKPPQVIVQGEAYGLLGTDNYGRGIWVGFVKSMRNTLYLALVTSVIIVVLGFLIDSISDILIMRFPKLLHFYLKSSLHFPYFLF